MITRDILEAQLQLYQAGHMKMMEGLERAKADAAAMSGAIESCQTLLGLLAEMEAANENEEGD